MAIELLSTEQVARFLGVTRQHVHQLHASGVLPGIFVGRGRVFRRDVVSDYAEARQVRMRAKLAELDEIVDQMNEVATMGVRPAMPAYQLEDLIV